MEAAAYLKQSKKIEKVVVVGMEKVPFERVLGEKIGEVMRDLHLSKGVRRMAVTAVAAAWAAA